MARLDDLTLRIDRPRPEFRRANPEAFATAQGDVDTIRRLGTIENRATDAKERFRAHFDRHEDVWVAAEALRLSSQRKFPTLDHPKPRGFDQGSNIVDLMMGQARRNVNARAIVRFATINTVKTRLQNAVVRNRPEQDHQTQSVRVLQASAATAPVIKKKRNGPET